MKTVKTTLAVTVLAAAFGLVLGLSAAPSDSYACHLGTKHNSGDLCGGSDVTPLTVDTMVDWDGDIDGGTVEPRLCVVEGVQPNGEHGWYGCGVDLPAPGNEVTYDLGLGEQTRRNGDDSLCAVFGVVGGIDLTPNSNYQYAWFDDCGEGVCSIFITNWFFGVEIIAATGGSADRITLEAWADAIDGVTGTIDNPNPFTNEHTLEVDEITISFFGNGTNKKLAACEYRPVLGNLTVGDVTFHSVPAP